VSVTVDANVLVYASNEADPVYPTARALIGRLAAGPDLVYLFWPALMGYIRIVTHPAIRPRPLPPAEANVFGKSFAPAQRSGFGGTLSRTAISLR
jgi:predicted nucleic acid-binding protein